MRYPRTKKSITVAAVSTAVLLGGGATLASAATGGNDGTQEPRLSGTVQAPAETTKEGNDTAASEQAQDGQLRSLAKISDAQAKAAAVKAVGGSATGVQLGDENGYVVYEVAVTTPSGVLDVKVDAGSGAVLAQESGDEAESGTESGTESGAESGTESGPGDQQGPAANNGPDTAVPAPSAAG